MPIGQDMHAAQSGLRLLYSLDLTTTLLFGSTRHDLSDPHYDTHSKQSKSYLILYENQPFLLLEIWSYLIKADPSAG